MRSWRFLEASEVLERSLPELAEAVAGGAADPFVLDPRTSCGSTSSTRCATS